MIPISWPIEIYRRRIEQKPDKISSFIIGALIVVIAFPFIVALMFVSLIVPQDKWEEFWDLFL